MSTKKSDNSIALFVRKAYNILQNPDYQQIIHWLPSGREFSVVDVTAFQTEILPKHFRHNNMHSFVRQLNMYGFHKCRKDPLRNIFGHEYFRKACDNLLPLVRRKPKDLQRVQGVEEVEQQNQVLQKPASNKQESTKPILLEHQSAPKLTAKGSLQEKSVEAGEQNRCSLNLMICASGEVLNDNPEIYCYVRPLDQIISESSSENISINDEIEKQRKASVSLRSGVSLVQTHNLLKTHNHLLE